MRGTLLVAIGVALACAGPPPAAPELGPAPAPAPNGPPEWVDAAVVRAVEAEAMPGTLADEDPAHEAELRAFFGAHPEYADAARLDALLSDACADGVIDTHERLAHPTPKVPLVVEVTDEQWRVVVAHAARRCTSDDWSFYTSEVAQALAADHVTTAYGGADHDQVQVTRGGAVVATAPLTGQGYLALRPGHDPSEVAHGMTDEVLDQLRAALVP